MAQSTTASINPITNTPSFISKIFKFCQQWNENSCRQEINLYELTQCFIRNKINDIYFKNNKRKDFILLLKQQCAIKASPSSSLWNLLNPFSSHSNHSQTDNILNIPSNIPPDPHLIELETENISLFPSKQQIPSPLSLSQHIQRDDIINIPHLSDPYLVALHQCSELETENDSLKQQNSTKDQQIELLLSSQYKLIKIIKIMMKTKTNKKFPENIDVDYSKHNKSELEIQSDWEMGEEGEYKSSIFHIDWIEHGPDSPSLASEQ